MLLFSQLQLYGFNSQLYRNFTEASTRSQGLVAISLLVQVTLIFHFIILVIFVLFWLYFTQTEIMIIVYTKSIQICS